MTLEIEQPPLSRDVKVLEDFVMLGTTVPEADYKGPDKGKRVVVCSAGLSELGLTRIHPLDWRNTPKRWHRYRVDVRKAGYGDSRPESYEPANTHVRNEDFIPLWPKKVRPHKLKPTLDEFKVDSLKEADIARLSLAIIEPEELELRMVPTDCDSNDVMDRFRDEHGNIIKARERFRWIPRLFFKDPAGYSHNLQLRDWGVYEFMRKRKYHRTLRESEENTIGGLALGPNSCLFVGNNMAHRTAWLVISVLNGIR